MIRLAILASGSGSNAQRLAEYFRQHPGIRVQCIGSNNPQAYVLERAANMGIPSRLFSRKEFAKATPVLEWLQEEQADFVILAGFLQLVPAALVQAYPDRIINIHPALLPAYGGKGMYGMHVHEAVVAAGEEKSGITIHLVNEEYDKGRILKQASVNLQPGETPESLAQKIHQLEYEWFPVVVEEYIKKFTPAIS